MTGKLIVFCGIDGSGKTTQENLLYNRFCEDTSIKVFKTFQPTNFFRETPWVKSYLKTGKKAVNLEAVALLSAADRQVHLSTTIIPKLKAGINVICNRYIYSSYAYFTVRGLPLEFIKKINPNIPLPDITILLDLPAKEIKKRILQRGDQLKFEEKKIDYLEKVRKNFLKVADNSFFIIDGMKSEEDIHHEIWKKIKSIVHR
jgi:dTMP kinase